MKRSQKEKMINGATGILKNLVRGASKGGKKSSSATNTTPAPKKPCGACGGKK